MWLLAENLMDLTVEEAMKIIDDGLCMGFEFKVENHEIFYC